MSLLLFVKKKIKGEACNTMVIEEDDNYPNRVPILRMFFLCPYFLIFGEYVKVDIKESHFNYVLTAYIDRFIIILLFISSACLFYYTIVTYHGRDLGLGFRVV